MTNIESLGGRGAGGGQKRAVSFRLSEREADGAMKAKERARLDHWLGS